jgi:hypothetical protein
MANSNDLEVIERERQVLELRRAGATFEEIARAVGYKNHSGASEAYKRAIRRAFAKAGVDEMRELELDRLDRLTRAVWPKALTGDLSAVDRVLKIMHQRAQYVGLYSPAKVQVEAVVYDAGTIEGEVERLRLVLEQTGGEPRLLDGPPSPSGADTV